MDPSSQVTASPSGRRDRISQLPDGVLGDVLSFLPTPEAGRAAALCRRWRYIFCHVHTVSYEEQEGERSSDWDTTYYEAKERKSCSEKLLDGVCGALLCRRRCGGTDVPPLRTFRFAFDDFKPSWDALHADQWLTYVTKHADRDLHLDLRFLLGPICARDTRSRSDDYEWSGTEGPRFANTDNKGDETDSDSDDDNEAELYRLPSSIFSCAAIKTLCLAHCRLKLPAEVQLPCVETLRLTGIYLDSGRSVQRLVLSCPRLADLTLEAVRHLRTLSVLHRRLRRFALRCCHTAKSVHIDASRMVSLEYRGAVPAGPLLVLHGSPPQRYSCTVDICTPVTKNVANFRRLLGSFSATQRLHLHYGRLHSSCLADDGLPLFPHMTRLVLQVQGRVDNLRFIGAVRGILAQTPNLEVLTLYMAEQKEQQEMPPEDEGDAAVAVVPDKAAFSTACLRQSVKEINLVCYEGNWTQKTMARLLFGNAMVLETLCVVFKKECFAVQAGLKKEIEAWANRARAGSERIFK